MKTQLATLIYRNNRCRDNRWLCIIILLLLFTGSQGVRTTFSETSHDQSSINTPEPRPLIGTRGLGLSRAYISSADDATSPLWNPAGLASLDRANLIYDLSQGALSIAYPVKVVGTFGINLLDFNNADRFLIDHNSNPIGTFEYGYNQALLSYARNFGTLQLGVSTGLSRAPYKNSLWAQNYDVGALITLSPNALVGMQYRDINGVSIRDQNGVLLNTFNSQLAFGTTLIPLQQVKWHACYNVTSPSFGTSVEFITGPLSTNVGSHFVFHSGEFAQSWSMGISLNKWGKQTYYAYLNQGDLNHKHLLSFGFTFGDSTQEHTKETSTRKTPANTTHHKTDPKQNSLQKTSIQIAEKHNISVELMLAIIYVESKFNPVAVSRTGAGGLMQILPSTAREYGLKVPHYTNKTKPKIDGKVDERFDAKKNLEAGLRYFNYLLERYNNNRTLALGAYNIGPGRVKIKGPLLSRGKIYVDKVINQQQKYQNDKSLLDIDLSRLEAILNK